MAQLSVSKSLKRSNIYIRYIPDGKPLGSPDGALAVGDSVVGNRDDIFKYVVDGQEFERVESSSISVSGKLLAELLTEAEKSKSEEKV